ncbi:hypothetical protein ABB37_03452 [Leptomonas pyrrhocoris]|uniref:Uncharacterized protein n=1 Tax=Leptomonas pyrrhocoris TaxID=157538 RepID=A0A0N0DWZ3_LEPPY|nr:hypothetical protein ABB37_03452 [Leptomonas pyrrhocoris]KPA82368.1 hypothetical protein ABB37_03452 [Leptomonas pyrrhocoris]|eukprot:XP_015660807.1 hypothetical protein ABB37_03452 [Leptomonas pyrrhocoris]
MLCLTRRALLQRSRTGLEKFQSHSSGATPGVDSSMSGKIKTEMKKMLKIQLFLIPICVIVMVFMFPTPSEAEERRMREEYERNAGWKT